MNTLIDLQQPVKGEWEGRGFGRHFVWTYCCALGHIVRVRASRFLGKRPTCELGGMYCPQCDRMTAPAAGKDGG